MSAPAPLPERRGELRQRWVACCLTCGATEIALQQMRGSAAKALEAKGWHYQLGWRCPACGPRSGDRDVSRTDARCRRVHELCELFIASRRGSREQAEVWEAIVEIVTRQPGDSAGEPLSG